MLLLHIRLEFTNFTETLLKRFVINLKVFIPTNTYFIHTQLINILTLLCQYSQNWTGDTSNNRSSENNYIVKWFMITVYIEAQHWKRCLIIEQDETTVYRWNYYPRPIRFNTMNKYFTLNLRRTTRNKSSRECSVPSSDVRQGEVTVWA